MTRASKRRRYWTDEEIEILESRYPHEPTKLVADSLSRPVAACYHKAYTLGIKKTPECLRKHGHRLDGIIGTSTRFQKGHSSWNKGKKIGSHPNSKKTQFKKGSKPKTTLPIGTEVYTTKDRYLVRKVSDTGNQRRDWVPVHKLLWIEHHGEIPAGHIIVFRNKDRTDIRIENIECVSRSELMRRNTVHNLPDELKPVVMAKRSLTRAINKEERQNEEQH